MLNFHLSLADQGTNQPTGKCASNRTYTRDHTGKHSRGHGSQPSRKWRCYPCDPADCAADSPKELIGLAGLIFTQAKCAANRAQYLTDLIFGLELRAAIVSNLLLKLELWVAVRIIVVAGLRAVVMTRLVLELELRVTVRITVVSCFVSNGCFKQCHSETSLSIHEFQEAIR